MKKFLLIIFTATLIAFEIGAFVKGVISLTQAPDPIMVLLLLALLILGYYADKLLIQDIIK